jgi:hypothetical protein
MELCPAGLRYLKVENVMKLVFQVLEKFNCIQRFSRKELFYWGQIVSLRKDSQNKKSTRIRREEQAPPSCASLPVYL